MSQAMVLLSEPSVNRALELRPIQLFLDRLAEEFFKVRENLRVKRLLNPDENSDRVAKNTSTYV